MAELGLTLRLSNTRAGLFSVDCVTPSFIDGLGPVNRDHRQAVHRWVGLPDRRGLKKSLRLVGRWAWDDMNIAAIDCEGVCC